MSHSIRFGISSARARVLGLLLLFVGLLHASPARATYFLTLEISDTLGHTATQTTGPFAGSGSNLFSGLAATFTEFNNFAVIATANESSAASFLNKVDITGFVKDGTPTFDLTVKLTGSGFTQPTGGVSATQGVSSSSVPGSFTSLSLDGTLAGTLVASQSIPPVGAVSNTTALTVSGAYDGVLTQTFHSVVAGGLLNATSDLTWTSTATPEPGSLTLLAGLFFGLGGSALYRSRKARQAGA